MPFLASDSFNLLAINPGLVFWTVVTFLVVLFVLWLFAWKPIIQALDARNDKIEDELRESQRLREEAEHLLQTYQLKIENAKKEIVELTEQGKKDAEEAGSLILKQAESKNKELIVETKKEIEQAKFVVVQELQETMVHTTMQIISKILKVDIDDKKHTDLVVGELSKVSLSGRK